jgi:hypothetical protein
MVNVRGTFEDLQAGVTLSTHEAHVLVLRKRVAAIIEMDDLNFHSASAVVLPVPPPAGEWEQGHIGGLDCIARCLAYSQESGHQLMVIGHTDSTGGSDANLTLSERRAENARRLLTGDKSAWAEACNESHRVEDYQLILAWVRDAFGWNCDPGAIDNRDGPATRGALDRFRAQYDESFGASLPRDPPVPTLDDWSAFFDLYEAVLADKVDVQSMRGGLRFTEPPILACGEAWPIAGQGRDNFRSSANRRVELVFFEETPPDLSATTPAGGILYGSRLHYRKTYVPIDPVHRFYFSV